MYNTFYFVGAMIVGWVTYGSLAIDSDYAWRVPIYLQAVAPALVLVSAPFLAESPRWLLAHDRQDDARAMLAKYHGDGDPESPLVRLEMQEMIADISLEGKDKVWWDYRPLFNSHEARWRIAMVIGMAFVGQWAGNGAVTYYLPGKRYLSTVVVALIGPVMLKQAGIKSSREQILYNAILNTLSYPCATFAALFIAGRFGRRTIFITASLLFCLEFIIITALTANYSKPQYIDHPNINASKATMAFIFLFRLTYSLTFTPLHPVYPVECLSFETRAKGAGFYTIMDSISSFFNTYVTPIGLGRAR
jgi:MFS family permease